MQYDQEPIEPDDEEIAGGHAHCSQCGCCERRLDGSCPGCVAAELAEAKGKLAEIEAVHEKLGGKNTTFAEQMRGQTSGPTDREFVAYRLGQESAAASNAALREAGEFALVKLRPIPDNRLTRVIGELEAALAACQTKETG
ncbi:MAG: hypothetical protein AB7I37_26255 [Pirellulales bacterium]